MASSSSSSFHPTSWRKYDVFLSFRGTDTRYTFVDHLYNALKQQGISTFKDDEELPRGEIINPSLLNAIEESQIAVVVFSENYADSSWCLQELEHIMKCKVERGLIVIPIFYHVDPSEIRKQKRKYGEAFAKHESEKKNVESWRKALSDAGNLSGHVPNGPETIFIKNIVEEISKRLCMPIPSDNEDLIGMEDRLQDLKSKLAMDSEGGVMMVGIWGLGGGGKTTLARALYDQISTKFDGYCFLNNIREESGKHGLEELQKEILSRVLKQKREEVVGYGDVRDLIKIKLRRKKVLLVLDDIDNANQLEALAGSHDWFNKGSRIIITTRNQHLLNTHGVNVIYNICLLNHDEAMKLFCKHALRHGNHIQDYDSLAKKVVSYAGGLPLALKVMGSFLCDKEKSEWVSTLARLKEIPEDGILETLKISYDGLKSKEKELFLDIVCFFRGDEFSGEPLVILEACGFYPKVGVRVLIQKALITVTKEGKFDMHDLIEEMGHYIVRGKNLGNPKKYSRVWELEDVVTICATPTEARTVKFKLALYTINKLCVPLSQENHWIEALEVTVPLKKKLSRSLPHVVANMKELRWFSCNHYPATSLPTNFQSTKVFYLRLNWSSLKQLWKGYKHLPNLKVLDLSHSRKLIRTPDFDGLPCLERIRLNHCGKLTYIDPSISHHERLISVEMEYCSSLKEFPPISGMKNLETLLLSKCYQLCKFPEVQMIMDKLVKLSLSGTKIKVVPSSVGQYCTNLLFFDLRGCGSLKSIEGNFHLLKHLKEFYIYGYEELKIPAEGLFDVNCCLQVLDSSYTSFKNLHPGIVSMKFLGLPPSLRRLYLCSCDWINGDMISSVLNGLSNLQELDLRHNDFSRLDCSLLQLPFLKSLNLSGCYNLVELPDLPASIAILDARWCDKLKIVHLPTNLKWLWRISVPMESILGDVEREVQSILEGDAIKDYSISLYFPCPRLMQTRDSTRRRVILELPSYNKFSGFLLCIEGGVSFFGNNVEITIKDVTDGENEGVLEVSGSSSENEGVLEVSGSSSENEGVLEVCSSDSSRKEVSFLYIYISLGSLRHTSWWKSTTHTTISFSMQRRRGCGYLKKVEVVEGGETRERVKDTTNSSEIWDTEPIYIIHDSKSCIKIRQYHYDFSSMIREIF